jgi:ubiquinone/menaquinone biosynthesis C-methylase UbiE
MLATIRLPTNPPTRSSTVQTTDRLFAGSIPDIYDRFLVPLIFESYAIDLAERIARADPRDVLETAAGTGVLTRAMAAKLPAHARIVATDLNQPMLDHAASRLHDGRIAWRQADALALPFQDQVFDIVTCQFGVMFFPDKVQGYKEARRVSRPGGRFLFNVWDRISENVFAEVVTEALAGLFPRDPPLFMARTPHGHHDIGKIRSELTTAGFASIAVETVDGMSRANSPRESRSPTARERPCGTRSRLAIPRVWRTPRERRKKPWRSDSALDPSRVELGRMSSRQSGSRTSQGIPAVFGTTWYLTSQYSLRP